MQKKFNIDDFKKKILKSLNDFERETGFDYDFITVVLHKEKANKVELVTTFETFSSLPELKKFCMKLEKKFLKFPRGTRWKKLK